MARKYEKQRPCNRRETLQLAEERHIRRIERRSGLLWRTDDWESNMEEHHILYGGAELNK
jgi:hypothetical protein